MKRLVVGFAVMGLLGSLVGLTSSHSCAATILSNVPDGGWVQGEPIGDGTSFDTLDNVQTALGLAGESVTGLTFLGKLADFDELTGAVGSSEGPLAGAFGVQFNPGPDLQSGTWTFDTTTDLGGLALTYFSLKAAGHWNLWTVTGTVSNNVLTDNWDISPNAPPQQQLWKPKDKPSANLSHISFWGVVPEPSTLVLLTIGAVSLLAYALRRRKQAAW